MDISALQVKMQEFRQGSACKNQVKTFICIFLTPETKSFPTHIASRKVWVSPPRRSKVLLCRNLQILHLKAHDKPVMVCPSVTGPTFVSSSKDGIFSLWLTSGGLSFQKAALFPGTANCLIARFISPSAVQSPLFLLSPSSLPPSSAIKGKDMQSSLNRRVYKGSDICLTWKMGK